MPPVKSLDNETAVRLRAALGRLSRQLRRTNSDAGLTPTETSGLGVVRRSGPIRLHDLATSEGLHPTMASRVVAGLERSGVVRRRRDPADRRVAWVEMTAAGRRLHDRLRTERARVLGAVLGELGPQQERALLEALPVLEELGTRLQGRSRAGGAGPGSS